MPEISKTDLEKIIKYLSYYTKDCMAIENCGVIEKSTRRANRIRLINNLLTKLKTIRK